MKNFFQRIYRAIFGDRKGSTTPKKPSLPVEPHIPVEISPAPELPTVGDKPTLKLGIVVGHERKAPGAVVTSPINSNEYFVNSQIAEQIRREAVKRGLQCVVILRDKVGIGGAYGKAISQGCDAVIELHFNAFNRKAFGTETLCTKSSDDRAFASIVQKHLVKCFKRTGAGDRKIKPLSISDRGGFSVHSFPTGVNCLVEPFFSDNTSEVALYLSVKDQYPKALVEAVIEWANSIGMLQEKPIEQVLA